MFNRFCHLSPDSSLITLLMMKLTLGQKNHRSSKRKRKRKKSERFAILWPLSSSFLTSLQLRLVVPGAKLGYALYLIKFLHTHTVCIVYIKALECDFETSGNIQLMLTSHREYRFQKKIKFNVGRPPSLYYRPSIRFAQHKMQWLPK